MKTEPRSAEAASLGSVEETSGVTAITRAGRMPVYNRPGTPLVMTSIGDRIMRVLGRTILVAAVGLTLSGCQSLRASQEPLPGFSPPSLVSSEQALFNYHHPDDRYRLGMSRREYRDYVVGIYLTAIEANYTTFADMLEDGERETGFLSDLLLVALTGATSLVDASHANELATVTAMAAGGRATVDHRLFFDRTLPAVIAAMDADRTTILAEIQRKRNLPIEQYSLGEALDDLQRLQRAGRLSRGITRVTRAAEADRALQQTRLDSITAACDNITADAGTLNEEFRNLVYTNAATRDARLRAAAGELNIDLAEGEAPTWPTVRAAFAAQLCDDNAKREFINKLRTRIEASAATES